MWQAIWVWRKFPRQISSDLRCRGLHIKHWLRGTRGADGDMLLSSYELLEFLEFLPEDSAFKTAARRGGWTTDQKMWAAIYNEVARFRASFHSRAGKPFEPDLMRDPLDEVLAAEAEKVHAESRVQVEATLFRGFGNG